MTAAKMESIVQELSDIFNEISTLIGFDPSDDQSRLHPPADLHAIEEFEEAHQPFPKSYRTFLELHNGWENYQGVFTLIGVSGAHTRKALAAIKESIRIFMMKWDMAKRPINPEFIAHYESKGRKNGKTLDSAHIYLPYRLVFGTDFAGSLMFFNPMPGEKRGATEVICRDQHFRIVERHADFSNMLEADLRFYREDLKEKRREARGDR